MSRQQGARTSEISIVRVIAQPVCQVSNPGRRVLGEGL
jgi:hypothetical protein